MLGPVVFTLQRTAAYRVRGRTAVRPIDARGTLLPVRAAPASEDAERPVALRRGQCISVMLLWSNYCGPAPVGHLALRIVLPDGHGQLIPRAPQSRSLRPRCDLTSLPSRLNVSFFGAQGFAGLSSMRWGTCRRQAIACRSAIQCRSFDIHAGQEGGEVKPPATREVRATNPAPAGRAAGAAPATRVVCATLRATRPRCEHGGKCRRIRPVLALAALAAGAWWLLHAVGGSGDLASTGTLRQLGHTAYSAVSDGVQAVQHSVAGDASPISSMGTRRPTATPLPT